MKTDEEAVRVEATAAVVVKTAEAVAVIIAADAAEAAAENGQSSDSGLGNSCHSL